MENEKLRIDIYESYIHYYLNNTYIGMLVFDKGELSDFRAIVRKNRLHINKENIFDILKTSLYALLNHYLSDSLFVADNTLESLKAKIVQNNTIELKRVSQEITDTNILKGAE